MSLTVGYCRAPEDIERIRTFFRDVLILNGCRQICWDVVRFDYWVWLGIKSLGHGDLETGLLMWETEDKQIAAILNREGPGNVFLQMHPDFNTPQLQEEMIVEAEKSLTTVTPKGERKLRIWCDETDLTRQEILERRGFLKDGSQDYHRIRLMSDPVPKPLVAEDYTIRGMRGDEDLPPRSFVSWRAFHPDEPDDKYQGWEWYATLQKAPLYRKDLDIVAVAPDGSFAAFCTVWFDEVTGIGTCEPVGTAPQHQRRGLARAVINEGLKRLGKLGATHAHIGSWNEATNSLYGSLGFTDYHISEGWTKTL